MPSISCANWFLPVQKGLGKDDGKGQTSPRVLSGSSGLQIKKPAYPESILKKRPSSSPIVDTQRQGVLA